jgi:hypothetical protein
MASSKFNQLYIWISALLLHGLHASALPSCPHNIHADYDFVVVGAGVGGGPVAARLAESGFSGMLFTHAPKYVVNQKAVQFSSLMQATMLSTSIPPSHFTLPGL